MKKSIVLSILMLLSVSGAYATNGMRMIGFGPVQDSMGGASAGINLDAASVLTNPAGIQSLGGRVDFGASFFNPSVKTEMMGTEFSSDKKASPVPAFGLIIPIDAGMSFGLGAYGISGMGVDYNLGSMGGLLATNYSNMRFAPGLAYKINDMITVGATLNIMYATMEYSMFNPSYTVQIVDMSSSSFGYGATVGATVKPMDMLSIGIVYETTSKFQDFKFNQYMSTPAAVTGAGTTSENSLKFDQPMSATLGFGLKPLTGLALAFDIQWIRWSETNGKNLPEFTGGNFNMQWSDQLVYKFGFQYEVIPMVKIRAGVNYGKMPLGEDNASALQANLFFPAVSEWHYTAGAGVKVSDKTTVDLGFMYSPEAAADSAYGKSKMSQYSLDMGIAYNF